MLKLGKRATIVDGSHKNFTLNKANGTFQNYLFVIKEWFHNKYLNAIDYSTIVITYNL